MTCPLSASTSSKYKAENLHIVRVETEYLETLCDTASNQTGSKDTHLCCDKASHSVQAWSGHIKSRSIVHEMGVAACCMVLTNVVTCKVVM